MLVGTVEYHPEWEYLRLSENNARIRADYCKKLEAGTGDDPKLWSSLLSFCFVNVVPRQGRRPHEQYVSLRLVPKRMVRPIDNMLTDVTHALNFADATKFGAHAALEIAMRRAPKGETFTDILPRYIISAVIYLFDREYAETPQFGGTDRYFESYLTRRAA